MIQIKRPVLVMAILMAMSCNKKDDTGKTDLPDETALSLVTGINARETPDQLPLTLGNPNVLTLSTLSVYPTVPRSIINIASNNTITSVWIIPATAEKIYQEVDFGNVLNSSLYAESELETTSIISLNNQSSNVLSVDLESTPTGYYRVFAKISGVIYWDNIYVLDDSEEIEDLIDFWN